MKTYKFAIVGCGMISNFHAAALAEIENAVLSVHHYWQLNPSFIGACSVS